MECHHFYACISLRETHIHLNISYLFDFSILAMIADIYRYPTTTAAGHRLSKAPEVLLPVFYLAEQVLPPSGARCLEKATSDRDSLDVRSYRIGNRRIAYASLLWTPCWSCQEHSQNSTYVALMSHILHRCSIMLVLANVPEDCLNTDLTKPYLVSRARFRLRSTSIEIIQSSVCQL